MENLLIFQKKLQEFWVLGEKIEFWVFLAWVLVFSPWVFGRMSKKQACCTNKSTILTPNQCENLAPDKEMCNSHCTKPECTMDPVQMGQMWHRLERLHSGSKKLTFQYNIPFLLNIPFNGKSGWKTVSLLIHTYEYDKWYENTKDPDSPPSEGPACT